MSLKYFKESTSTSSSLRLRSNQDSFAARGDPWTTTKEQDKNVIRPKAKQPSELEKRLVKAYHDALRRQGRMPEPRPPKEPDFPRGASSDPDFDRYFAPKATRKDSLYAKPRPDVVPENTLQRRLAAAALAAKHKRNAKRY